MLSTRFIFIQLVAYSERRASLNCRERILLREEALLLLDVCGNGGSEL